MEIQPPTIEPAIDQALTELITLLVQKEEIKQYQKAEKHVESNRWLQEAIEAIKLKQQELVNFEYYEKPEAYRATLEELAEMNRQLDENITVQYYKDTLVEADEVVQHLFSSIQGAVDQIR